MSPTIVVVFPPNLSLPLSLYICHAKGSMSVGEAKGSLSYSGNQAGRPTQPEIFNSSVTALLLQVWNHRAVGIFCRHPSIKGPSLIIARLRMVCAPVAAGCYQQRGNI